MKIAQIQMKVGESRKENLEHALDLLKYAAGEGAAIACLPEMFICPYRNEAFVGNAEAKDGQTVKALSLLAAEAGMGIVAGSIPEMDDGKVYNTSFVIDPSGAVIARHRKIHLFDINVPGKIAFRESDTLSPGIEVAVFEMCGMKAGLAVCFDIRFPELFSKMSKKGVEAIFIPAAFNLTTGPAHWHLLARARAVDTQGFLFMTSAARNEDGYRAYGHTLSVHPWGNVLAEAGEGEEIVYTEFDPAEVERVRKELPVLSARRPEAY